MQYVKHLAVEGLPPIQFLSAEIDSDYFEVTLTIGHFRIENSYTVATIKQWDSLNVRIDTTLENLPAKAISAYPNLLGRLSLAIESFLSTMQNDKRSSHDERMVAYAILKTPKGNRKYTAIGPMEVSRLRDKVLKNKKFLIESLFPHGYYGEIRTGIPKSDPSLGSHNRKVRKQDYIDCGRKPRSKK